MVLKIYSPFILFFVVFVGPLFSKEKIAILDFVPSNISQDEAELVTEEVRSILFEINKYQIMERDRMESIFNELGLSQTDMVCQNDSCGVKFGNLLGVNKLITGSLGEWDGIRMVSARIINVGTGQIENNVSERFKGDTRVFVKKIVPRLLRNLTGDQSIKDRSLTEQNPPWWKWGSAGLSALGFLSAGYFHLQAEDAMKDYNQAPRGSDFDNLRNNVNRADRTRNVLLGGGVVFLAGSGFFWWLESKSGKTKSESPQQPPINTSDGKNIRFFWSPVAVTATWRF